MIADPIPSQRQFAPQNLQNPLTAESLANNSPVAETMIPRTVVGEFALQINAAMIQMLAAQGVSTASPLSKKLRAYATAGVRPIASTSRFV